MHHSKSSLDRGIDGVPTFNVLENLLGDQRSHIVRGSIISFTNKTRIKVEKSWLALTYDRHGIVERRVTIVASATGHRLLDENGSIVSEAEYGTGGTVNVLDSDCGVVNRWSQDQLQSIAQRQ